MFQLFKIARTLLLSIALFVSSILFSAAFMSHSMTAFAEPVTPEAAAYEIDNANSPEEAARTIKNKAQDYKQELDEDTHYTAKAAKKVASATKDKLDQSADTIGEKTRQASDRAADASDKLTERSENKLKGIADNVREKLNLDEPIPQSTREFLGDAEEKVDEAVRPVTGNSGYFKAQKADRN
ncbi:hypothetical protein H6F43_16395 [Leptolyngbya sp. FACHB-36]|uniref:hypothetical protein n=1 Tax=Leptolyngbya sp. FACHB-36 TaxID=2692808 RepID=UPI0016801DCC|nr:hypothetical protein [Leptolyngbya sp. FACHB-36]MBD2021761.1 hypothetical protein [Leptolyngbya sp. FACHB-36]